MGRALRADEGGYVYHVLNRANARLRIFSKDSDYAAFETVLAQAQERFGTRLLAYCVLPNHWHLVLWPKEDGELSRFTGWLTLTHTQRWHAQYHNVGTGHLYQGRFKSFPVQEDEHLLSLCRYVERNPLRAELVAGAEDWRWCSLWRRERGTADEKKLLSDWPVARPKGWLAWVQEAQTPAELEGIRRCVQRGQPFGTEVWVKKAVRTFGLELTMRPGADPRREEKVPDTFFKGQLPMNDTLTIVLITIAVLIAVRFILVFLLAGGNTGRIGTAIRGSWRILRNPEFAGQVATLLDPPPSMVEQPKPDARPLRLLAILQRDGRLLDFLMEDLQNADPTQIADGVKFIQPKCQAVLKEHLVLEPVIAQPEGSTVEVAAGFDPSAIRLVGNVTGQPPFRGTLGHAGWRVKAIKLVPPPEGQDEFVLMPAEVELP